MIYASIALGLVFFVLFVIKCHKQRSVGGVFLKNAISAFFIITAVIALADKPSEFQYGILILAGLVFGMLGDIYLDQKWVYPADDKKYLYAGFISFAIGHLFYIPAIIINARNYGLELKYLWIAAAFAVFVSAFVLISEKPTKQHFGEFKITVMLYGLVVAGMAGVSMVAAVCTKQPRFICCAIGGVMFLLSDLILSPMYFGPKEKNNPTNFFINHLTYYIAQYLLAFSISLVPALAN